MDNDSNTIYYKNDGCQLGHTVLYDKGVEMSSNEIFCIFHADMVCGPNFVENLLKWLHPGGIVAATRIEPPLHPEGKEKIIKDFGIYNTDFKEIDFRNYCEKLQKDIKNQNIITRGIFAPWLIYKKDFLAIGGHDKLFSPFPYEDSDIFQRMILAHYEINQSRDAFVYHFTCRGHRWTKKVQQDDFFYKLCCAKNVSHFIRKWGSWVENDENCYPIIQKKYDIGFVAKNCQPEQIGNLEPWCSTIYCDCNTDGYIQQVQVSTPFDLKKRVKRSDTYFPTNDIIVTFDVSNLTNEGWQFLSKLPKIISDSGEIGPMEFDIFKIQIQAMTDYSEKLVKNDDPYYTNQLRPFSPTDPYCTNELFTIYERTKDKI
jgi:hypothetical protein